MEHTQQRGAWLSRVPLILASLLGLAAFFYPFIIPPVASRPTPAAHADDAPLVFLLLMTLLLATLLAEIEARQLDAKTIALLGVLAAINASLRLVHGPAGFNAVFFLPILAGYVFGAEFGFLLGALSLFVSALLTGGVGPWLPFQMFALGWIGLSAGWLPDLERRPRAEVILLVGFGLVWGLLFGAIMNLWFWPFLEPGAAGGATWQSGSGWLDGLRRYAVFYLATSLWWDAWRAGGNTVLLLVAGAPVLRLLRRFRRRFFYQRLSR